MINPNGNPLGGSVLSPTGGPAYQDEIIKDAAPNVAGASVLGNIYASPLLAAGLNFFGGMYGASKQAGYNKELAAFQHEKNMEILKYQLDYNTPKNQMARFKEAGLNPNLIYGKGTPGNMESAPRYPDIQAANYQSVFADIGTKLAQMRLMDSQADLTQQRVVESGVKQDLMRAQEDLTRANPYMRPEYVNSIVMNIEAMAKMKAQEASFLTSKTSDENGVRWERGFLKMQRELDLLGQRYKLGESDQRVKAEVIESKDFQNRINEVMSRWMTDGDITPEHYRQFGMMLLQKFMGR